MHEEAVWLKVCDAHNSSIQLVQHDSMTTDDRLMACWSKSRRASSCMAGGLAPRGLGSPESREAMMCSKELEPGVTYVMDTTRTPPRCDAYMASIALRVSQVEVTRKGNQSNKQGYAARLALPAMDAGKLSIAAASKHARAGKQHTQDTGQQSWRHQAATCR